MQLVPMKTEALLATSSLVEDPNDVCPQLKLEHGDALIIDGAWWAFVGSDRHGISIQEVAGGRIQRKLSHYEAYCLYWSPERRMLIKRRTVGRMPSVIAHDIDRPLVGYPKRDVDAALERLEYVAKFAELFNKKLVSRTRAGFERVIRLVSWLRRRRKAKELSNGNRHVRAADVGQRRWGWSTVREWFWRWELSDGLLAAIVPRNLNKGSREQKLHAVVRRMIHDIVKERWLTLEKLPLTMVHGELCSRVNALNDGLGEGEKYDLPDIRSVWRWIDRNLNDFEICWYREGSKVANERFRNVRKGPVGAHPLHTVQIDYTRLDSFVVSENGEPVSKDGTADSARPWIVVAICTLTRMIVGWYLTMDAPSWESAMACLRHMALPKDFSRIPEIQSAHPGSGMCEVLQLDNEKAFRSRSMDLASGALKFRLDYGPAGQSRIRGIVERWFREVNHRGVAAIPGRAFPNTQERGDYDSQGLAAFTLPEMERWIAIWIVDVYHNRPHGGLLGMTPLQKWHATRSLGVKFAESVDDLEAILSFGVERTVQREGVRVLGLRFNGKELDHLRRRRRHKGIKYAFKLDPNDLTVGALYDDVEEKWIYVRCTTPELVRDVTLLDWREACKLTFRTARNERSYRTMQDALRLLMEDKARRGGSRETRRMTQSDLDWFRNHEDDEIFDTVIEDGVHVIAKARQSDGGMKGDVPMLPASDPNAAVLDDGAPVEIPDVEDAAEEAPSPQAVENDASGNDDADFDPHDPANW